MFKTAKFATILILILSFFTFISCENINPIEKAENIVLDFHSATKNGNIEEMLELYKGMENIYAFWPSDTIVIEQVKEIEGGIIEIKTKNPSQTNQGEAYERVITYYVKQDEKNKSDFYIFDTKGFFRNNENLELFAQKIGAPNKTDATDQTIAKDMLEIDDILFNYVNIELGKLVNQVNVTELNLEDMTADAIHLNGNIQNNSTFHLKGAFQIKFIFIDSNGKEIPGSNDLVLENIDLSPGESQTFKYKAPFTEDMYDVRAQLLFDENIQNMIYEYVMNQEFTGNEYNAYTNQ